MNIIVSSGKTYSNANLWYPDTMDVLNGGTAINTTVGQSAFLFVSQGGKAISTYINCSGVAHIDGGTASNTIVSGGWDEEDIATMEVYSGGIAKNTSLQENSILNIRSGGTASVLSISSGSMLVANGLAEHTNMSSGRIEVCRGGVARDTIISYGAMFVYSDSLAVSTTIESGALIISGGTASATTYTGAGAYWNESSRMEVTNGGIAEDTIILSSGAMVVQNEGIARKTTIYSGCLNISDGGFAISTTVLSSGNFSVYGTGATATSTFFGGASMNVGNGGVAEFTTVTGNTVFVETNGIINDTFVSGGIIDLRDGGSANRTELTSGVLYMNEGYNGGVANDTTVLPMGRIVAANSAILNRVTILGSGTISASHATINDITVSSGGVASFGFGAAVTGATLYGGASAFLSGCNINDLATDCDLTIYDGATIDSITLNSSVEINVSSGGSVNNAIVFGSMSVLLGGKANEVIVNSGGYLQTSRSAKINDVTVNSQGEFNIQESATVSRVEVNAGGLLNIHTDTKTTGIIENGGYVFTPDMLTSETIITFSPNRFSGLVLDRDATIHSGTTAVSTTLTGCTAFVFDGGSAVGTVVNSSGYLQLSPGATATNTILNGGILKNTSATATGTTINDGSMEVIDGTVTNTTVNQHGSMLIAWVGSASYTTVNSNAIMTVSGGVFITDTTINGGHLTLLSIQHQTDPEDNTSETVVIGDGATATRTYLNSGHMDINAGCIANDTVVSGAYLNVNSKSLANNTTVTDGIIYINSGGTATGVTLNADTSMGIDLNGSATDIILNSGAIVGIRAGSMVYVDGDVVNISGGKAERVTVNEGGYLYVSSGGIANGVIENGGIVSLDDEAKVTFIDHTFSGHSILNGGAATLHSGTTAVDLYINEGTLILNGGKAINAVASKGNIDFGFGSIDCMELNNSSVLEMNGGVAVNVNLYSESEMYVDDGTAKNTVVNSGTWLEISETGIAQETVLYVGASMNVSINGRAEDTIIHSGAELYVSGESRISDDDEEEEGGEGEEGEEEEEDKIRSGITIRTAVNSGGTMFVQDYGVASETRVNSSGLMLLSGAGTGEGTIVNSGGTMIVSSGGTAIGGCVSSAGKMFVFSHAKTQSTTVSSGGTLVLSGGSGSDIVEDGGFVDVKFGTFVVTFAPNSFSGLVLSNNRTTVHSGTTAVRATVAAGGYMEFFSGSELRNGIKIVSGGSCIVTSNMDILFDLKDFTTTEAALINDWSLITGGSLAQYNISINALQASGTYSIADGAAAFNNGISITVDDIPAGKLYVGNTIVFMGKELSLAKTSSGELQFIVQNDDDIYVSDGITSNSIELTSRNMHVLSGGIAEFTTVQPIGVVYVSGGGLATDTTVSSGGRVFVLPNGVASDTVVESNGSMVISGGSVANTIVSSCGTMTIFSEGMATDTVVEEAGSMFLFSTGAAERTEVNSDGILYISAGGSATNTVVSSGGSMLVLESGIADHTEVNSSGSMAVSDGGHVYDTTNCGKMAIYAGGTASATKLTTEDRRANGVMDIVGGNAVETAISSGGIMNIYKNGSATNTTVNSSGNMNILSFGSATDTTVNFGGDMVVSFGGTADNVSVKSGGKVSVLTNGEMRGTLQIANAATVTMSSGAKFVFNLEKRTTADAALINDWSLITGGTDADYSITVSASQAVGTYRLAAGAAGFDKTVSIVVNHVPAGTLSLTKTVGYAGKEYFLVKTSAGELQLIMDSGAIYVSNGVTSTSRVLAARNMHVLNGGTAIGTVASSGGRVNVSGGIARGTTVSSGGRILVSGGTVTDTAINSGGSMIVSGGIVNNTSVNSDGRMHVSGGTISGMTVCNNGDLYVSRGSVIDAVVQNGGWMKVALNGIVNNVTVSNSGTLQIASGGELRGALQMDPGAIVSVEDGTRVVFELENRAPKGPALINDWSLIEGGADTDYIVTVSATQAPGTYTLAAGADDFSNTVSVKVAGVDAGSVSIGGTLDTSSGVYSLAKTADGELQFTIVPAAGDDVYVEVSLSGATVKRHAYLIGPDVTLENDTIGSNIFGRLGSTDPEGRDITIANCSAKRFYACGSFTEGLEQTGQGVLVQADVTGSTFSGGLFMGANSVDSMILADVYLEATAAASKLIMGGSNIGKQTDGENTVVNNLTIIGDVDMTLTNCIATSFCCGGSLLSNECQEDRTSDTTIEIIGGTYDAVAGGSLFQSKATNNMYSIINGNINISISGNAKVQTLYGASTAIYVGPTRKESVNGNVSVLIDVSQGAKVEKSIYAGGAGFCTVNGTGSITIKGAGAGDAFTTGNLVGASTYAAGDDRRIGNTSLNFENFSGTVGSRISFFTSFTVDETSSVNFTNYKSDFLCKDWYICADNASQVSVILSGNNTSAGRIHNIDFNNSNLEFFCELEEGDEWTIFKVLDDNSDLQTLCNFSDAQSFLLNDEEIEWDDDELCGISENETYRIEYRFDEDEHCGMLVASLA